VIKGLWIGEVVGLLEEYRVGKRKEKEKKSKNKSYKPIEIQTVSSPKLR